MESNNLKCLGKAEDTDNLQLAWEVVELAKVTFLNMTGKLTDEKKKIKDVDVDRGRYTMEGVGHPVQISMDCGRQVWKPGIVMTVVQEYTMEGVGHPVQRAETYSSSQTQ